MTNLAKINDFLQFWVKEETLKGFRVSSLSRKTFTLKHEYFAGYLARQDKIGEDDYGTVYYDDYLEELNEYDRDQLIDECVKEILGTEAK
jgi:hypothetical protein